MSNDDGCFDRISITNYPKLDRGQWMLYDTICRVYYGHFHSELE